MKSDTLDRWSTPIDNNNINQNNVLGMNNNNNTLNNVVGNCNNINEYKVKPKASKSRTNGRWAWVVLTCTVINAIISGGQLQSIHIYYLIFLEEFKQSSSYTAWISAAQGTALCVAGPVSSFLLPKLGARLTIMFGALLMASCYAAVFFANSIPYLIVVFALVGASECFMSGGNMAAIAMYFPKRSSFAMGIMFAGGGLGYMVAGMELEWAVETFGWRRGMLVQAAIVLQICVSGCLVLKPLANKEEVKPKQNGIAVISSDGTENHSEEKQVQSDQCQGGYQPSSLKSLILDPFFWLFVLSFVAFSAQFSTMMTILKGFVVSIDMETHFTTVLTTNSIGNMLGKVLGGPASQFVSAPLHLTAVAIACGVSNALYILVDQPWMLAVVGGAFGFCQGHLTIVWVLNVSWIYGPNEMPVVRGHIIFFGVIGALSFPPIAGYTVDIFGNYNIAMMMSSASCLLIALCSLGTYLIHRRKCKHNTNRSYDITSLPKMQAVPLGLQLVHYAPYVPT